MSDNKALTLEQLREMDGEPVWVDIVGGVWALVDADNDRLWFDRGSNMDILELSRKVYRRPPEGEET